MGKERKYKSMLEAFKNRENAKIRFALLFSAVAIILISILGVATGKVSMKVVLTIIGIWCLVAMIAYWMDETIDSKKRLLSFALVCLTLLASLPAMADFVLYGHDIEFHLTRLCAVAEEFKNHQFPVRMQSTTMNNYGYATSLFYADLFIYIPAALIALGTPVYMGYNLYVISVTFFTVLTSFLCFKKIFANEKIAFVGCFLYTISIYRLINVFVRAAVGEYTAMIFLPLVLLGIWNFMNTKEKIGIREYFPLVIGLTGLVESHILSCEMVAEFGLIFLVFNIRRFLHKEHLIAAGKVILWFLGLNAFFLVPFLMSYGMDIDVKTRELTAVGTFSLYPLQIFNIFVEYSTKPGKTGPIDEMPMAVGGVCLLGLLGFIIFFMNRKKWKLKEMKAYQYGKKIFFYAILALVMSSTIFPWGSLHRLGDSVQKLLCQIQYPWRYFGIATMLLVVLILCVLKILLDKGWNKGARLFGGAVVLIATLTASYFFKGTYDAGEAMYVYNYQDVGSDNCGFAEYVWAGTDTQVINTTTEPYASEATTQLTNYTLDKGLRSVYCETIKECNITLPVFYYDNYAAYDKDTGEEFHISCGENNCVTVSVPEKYNGTIIVEYQEPVIWKIAVLVTILSVVFASICFRITRKKENV